MKRVAGLVLILGLLGALVLIASCRDDIILEEPDTIKGDYEGTITYKVGSQIPEEQPITWRFTDIAFTMWYDEDKDLQEQGEGASRKFCDVQGDYTLSSGVSIDTSYTISFDICDESRNPAGTFALDRSTDTLKMTQHDGDSDATLTIKLLRE
jgi:hypothetical protein